MMLTRFSNHAGHWKEDPSGHWVDAQEAESVITIIELELARVKNELSAERDSARREACVLWSLASNCSPSWVAKQRGWAGLYRGQEHAMPGPIP